MQIGYSEETLRFNIAKQIANIESEFNWLKYYCQLKDYECVEDCAKMIQEMLEAILEDVESLKGEIL